MLPQQSFSKNKKAVLILEDDPIFWGNNFGPTQKTTGEVVFCASMVGYLGGMVEINIIESGDYYAAT